MVNAVKEQTSLEEIITASFSNYLPQKPIFAVHEWAWPVWWTPLYLM